MIKVKAEHKKKIKVLNKKIDSFKKLGDLNAHIVKLSEENDNLKETIAELEEEKGNYQLKMMGSSLKDSSVSENVEDLEAKLKDLSVLCEEQSKKLEDLESENISLKSQVESSNENLQKMTELQNERVTSEITSIQFEELSEKLEKEKNEAIAAKENLKVQHDQLLNKIDALQKEKLEMQSKLEQYIHENIELMDKLEKLSAEKVSSAESIEIVENLTHQEKLELEKYQKNLDPQSGKLKISEEHLEEAQDLNESVNQLTEETSELLQKIELFTVERREVMEKMESLTNENSQLNLKLKQIENNRDLLTETYEQLQSEKEELDNKIGAMKKENDRLQEVINSMKKEYDTEEKEELKKKLYDLEGEYIKLGEENENLRKELKDISEITREKHNVEKELQLAKNKIKNFEQKLIDNLEEISTYQSVIAGNKEEFIQSAAQLNSLNGIISSKDNEIQNYKEEIKKLNSTISDFTVTINNLEDESKLNKESSDKIELLENHLQDLKKTLEENLDQIGDYEKELEENSNRMRGLNQQLKEIHNHNLELQNVLDGKNGEIEGLNKKILKLQEILKEKDDMFHKVSSEMKDKFTSLQKQTDNNTESLEDIREPLQKKIVELTTKNNALVEKMKKIAANLKKKTQYCQDLEQQLRTEQEKWESELSEKDILLKKTKEENHCLRLAANTYQEEVKQLKHILSEKFEEQTTQGQEVEVRVQRSLQEELLESCVITETINSADTTCSKIQELELIIETQENHIRNYKDRINALEITLAEIDERRETLQQKTNELGVQLQEKSLSFEEISKTEDLLEEKLNTMTRRNAETEKIMETIRGENKELSIENMKLKEMQEKLSHKLTVAQERVNELLEVEQKVTALSHELEKSQNQINILEQEIQKLEVEKLQYQESATVELEKLNNDWQLQYDTLSKERSELNILCENFRDKVFELNESIQYLSDKISSLESKLIDSNESKKEIENEAATKSEEIVKLKIILLEKDDEMERHSKKLKDLDILKKKQLKSLAIIKDLRRQNNSLKTKLDESENEFKSIETQLQQSNDSCQQSVTEEIQNKLDSQETTEHPNQIFRWSDQEDNFSFAASIHKDSNIKEENQELHSSPKETVIDNSKEELLQKIRILEFMLKNVEIERDDMLNQCSCLSNELMKFVYEKEGRLKVESKITRSENQNRLEIEPEFVQISEPECIKKTAYLCYPTDEVEINKSLPSVESQILPEEFIRDSEETRIELQQMEFTNTRDIADNMPLSEGLIQKSEAYLCYPESKSEFDFYVLSSKQDSNKSTKQLEPSQGETREEVVSRENVCHMKETHLSHFEQSNVDAFGVDDDGWGWNPEEAKLEEKHNEEYETNPLRIKILELEGKVENMEKERETRMNEYQELQIKSAKLMKKLKELKVKNDKLQQGKKQEHDDMFNLENAIQEELKNQIEMLEKKISEISSELVKEKNDKIAIEKKVEGLFSTNQKMLEMREKQDIELLMWKRKSEELKLKFDQFEWGDNPSPERTRGSDKTVDKATEEDISRLKDTIAELNETVKDLTLDNEDLQSLLEEQRSLRVNAEKSKLVQALPENMKTEGEYLQVVKEREKLEEEVNNIISEKKKLQEEFNEIIKRNGEQLEEMRNLHELKEQMEKIIEERDLMVKDMSNTLKEEQMEKEILLNQLMEKSKEEVQVQELLHKISILEDERQNTNKNLPLLEELKKQTSIIENLLQEKEKISQLLVEKENEIQEIKMNFEQQSSVLKTELEGQIKNTERLILENENLCIKEKELLTQIQFLQQQMQEKDAEFAVHVEKLNQNWQILVDQRGSDVAESWKLHVDTRETEFAQTKEQLEKEINALEEKCNSLVNENNELRKNVDAEIRLEVDRVSALQQQINERQQCIHELSHALGEKQLQIENVEKQIRQVEDTIDNLKKTIDQNELKIKELNIIVETTQKQFNEKRIIVEAVVKKMEERSLSPILYDLESITRELEIQLNLVNPEEVSELHKKISDKECVISSLQNEFDRKTEESNTHLSTIQKQMAEIEKLNNQIRNSCPNEKLSELELALTNKEALITDANETLNEKIKELDESLKMIDEYKKVCADYDSKIEKLDSTLLEKEHLLSNLSYQLKQTQSLKENENENVQNLQYSLQQYQLQYDELNSTLVEKNSLIDVMNEELEKQQKIHIEREAEVEKLKIYVDELQRLHDTEKNQLVKNNLDIIETKNKEILALKDELHNTLSDIEAIRIEKRLALESVNYLQSQLQDQVQNIEDLVGQINYYKNLNEELSKKLNEYEDLQKRYEDLQKKYEEEKVLLNEEDKQMVEMKAIIEDQVLKIEGLKRKLFEKSNDYDSLIAEMDVRKDDLSIPDQSARPPMGRGQLIGPTCEDDLHEWVSRSELDIALYMLHQRDVRCEELTVELTQLLEERDTLQLRLSNAIREKEDFKKIADQSGKVVDISVTSKEASPSKGAIPKGRVSEIVLKSSGTELATEAQESSVNKSDNVLEHKLTELKNIGYKKDKTLLDEQQQRRLQQISIMHQHMEEASRLPAEAAARLVDANYTLSRDVQSPSKVLLNWLWGRSTPKINEL